MKVLKIVGKVLGILLLLVLIAAVCLYFFVLRYPSLKEDSEAGKWYRVAGSEMRDSEGGSYHALFKKGSENKLMIYFAGGGVSVNEETARDDTYNTRMVWPDALANVAMNMGGLASEVGAAHLKIGVCSFFPMRPATFTPAQVNFIIPIRTAGRRSSITTDISTIPRR